MEGLIYILCIYRGTCRRNFLGGGSPYRLNLVPGSTGIRYGISSSSDQIFGQLGQTWGCDFPSIINTVITNWSVCTQSLARDIKYINSSK